MCEVGRLDENALDGDTGAKGKVLGCDVDNMSVENSAGQGQLNDRSCWDGHGEKCRDTRGGDIQQYARDRVGGTV